MAPGVGGQEAAVRAPEDVGPDLGWSEGVSEVPTIDLSGLWHFDEAASDPMVEVWAGRGVDYEISQQQDRVVLTFRPENGEPNIQEYRWDGSTRAFERADAAVRERARWTQGGRTLQIEGRWWPITDRSQVSSYTFTYNLEINRQLVFRQVDDFGETVWRFTR